MVQVSWPALDAKGTAKIARDGIEARLQKVTGGEWELTLMARTTRVEEVRFPWWPLSTIGEGTADDWVAYTSANTGAAVSAVEIRRGFSAVCDAPGLCVSPVLIWATPSEAFLVAGTTWPPRHLQVLAGTEGFGLRYPSAIASGTSATLRALLNAACLEPGGGKEPWREVLGPYLSWRRQKTEAAHLVPTVPDWLENTEGWLNVQLQNMAAFDPQRVEVLRGKVRPLFPWVQFWGQMSNFAGPRQLAVPPLGPLERGNCCAVNSSLHRRYVPALPDLIRRAASDGRVGVYVQPGDGLLFDDAGHPTPGLAALRAWLLKNRDELGTNAAYVDRMGNQYYGDPLSVARFIGSELPPGTVIEYAEDLYPAAYLISGALGGGRWDGRPGNTPEELGRGFRHGTFPRLGRYLVGDRIVFLGQSNGDARWWGPEHDYWGERQAFLLGAKFDSITPLEGSRGSERIDEAIAEAVAERQRVGWWQRHPVYLDREGIYDLPAGIDARHFRDRSGQDLLAIENWKKRNGISFLFEGRKVAVPAKRLSIWESPSEAALPAAPGTPGQPSVTRP